MENFSSNSWIFYMVFFIMGTLEMVYSFSLYMGFRPLEFEKDQSIMKY
jgi:hypothetical protein